ncbi:hypothetical protein LZG00_00465 [Rhodobacteraceae bacterium LMO-12]|nr:hypothetical protein [Rhodobacteraceae bacterium LMO-JJ12]
MRPAISEFADGLLERQEYLRFFMLEFNASIERDPVTATRDFLFDNKTSLDPNPDLLPDGIRLVYLKRQTYGKSTLTVSEIEAIAEALERPNRKVVSTAKALLLDHLSLSNAPPRSALPLLEKLFTAIENPRSRGRSATYNINRNSVINFAVQRLTSSGLTKTGVNGSACDIVADELCRIGYPISADGVRKIVDALKGHVSEREEVEMVMDVIRQGVSPELAEKQEDAWRVLEGIGKKMGYIPSNDTS